MASLIGGVQLLRSLRGVSNSYGRQPHFAHLMQMHRILLSPLIFTTYHPQWASGMERITVYGDFSGRERVVRAVA